MRIESTVTIKCQHMIDDETGNRTSKSQCVTMFVRHSPTSDHGTLKYIGSIMRVNANAWRMRTSSDKEWSLATYKKKECLRWLAENMLTGGD